MKRSGNGIGGVGCSIVALTILGVMGASDRASADCGHEGERACCVFEKDFGPCRDGLRETQALGTCSEVLGSSNCQCGDDVGGANALKSSGICVAETPCGGDRQRACCFWEQIPPCNSGLVEAPLTCHDILGNVDCGCSLGVCVDPTPCGHAGQRACCEIPPCKDDDFYENTNPTCASQLGVLDCTCDSGIPAIGVCKEKHDVGESCDPGDIAGVGSGPCKSGLQCLPVGFENGVIQHQCFADLDDFISPEQCNAFYNPNVHDTAINGNITLNFGYGASAGAGAEAATENGVVYGRDGCFGCYHTECVGIVLDVGIEAFVTIGESLVDLVCDPSDASCIGFDGADCVTSEGAGIPVVDVFGVSTSQGFANCDQCLPVPLGPCELVATSQSFSIGIGLSPITLSTSECTTIMTVAGCIENGVYVPGANAPPVCDAGGAYFVECNGNAPSVTLSSASTDANGDSLTYSWSVLDCPGASLSSETAGSPTFLLNELTSCPTICNLSLTVNDGQESSTCSTYVKFRDTSPPSIVCPAHRAIECVPAADTSVAANGSATGADTCHDTVDITHEGTYENRCGNTGEIERRWTATDGCNRSRHCRQFIEILDTMPPSIDTASSSDTVECNGSGNTAALAAWLGAKGGASSSDLCGGVKWTDDFLGLSSACGATGSATVTFTVKDECGLESSTSATFTIQDTTPPSIDPPASDSVVECDGSGNTAVLNAWLAARGGASSSDVCGQVRWRDNYAGLSDGCGATGSAQITFTTQDECGLESSTSASFAIRDTTPPEIQCPAGPIRAESSAGQCTLAVPYSVTASDVCGSTSIDCVANRAGITPTTTGGTFPVGTTTVRCTATDDCGRTSQCQFDVVANDPPVVQVSPASQSVQYSDQVAAVTITARDCGDDDLTLSTTALPAGLSLDSATCGPFNGGTQCTWTLDGPMGERAGTYTVDVTPSDGDLDLLRRESRSASCRRTPRSLSTPAMLSPRKSLRPVATVGRSRCSCMSRNWFRTLPR